jgi:hypothetical protein
MGHRSQPAVLRGVWARAARRAPVVGGGYKRCGRAIKLIGHGVARRYQATPPAPRCRSLPLRRSKSFPWSEHTPEGACPGAPVGLLYAPDRTTFLGRPETVGRRRPSTALVVAMTVAYPALPAQRDRGPITTYAAPHTLVSGTDQRLHPARCRRRCLIRAKHAAMRARPLRQRTRPSRARRWRRRRRRWVSNATPTRADSRTLRPAGRIPAKALLPGCSEIGRDAGRRSVATCPAQRSVSSSTAISGTACCFA